MFPIHSGRCTEYDLPLEEKLFLLMDYYNPTSMTDINGDVVERYRFSAFGLRQVTDANWAVRSSSSYDVTFAFHGEFRDPESGLDNYGYRYYSPHLGRWINKDPIEEKGGVNLYEFVGNDSISSVDLLGLSGTWSAEEKTKADCIARCNFFRDLCFDLVKDWAVAEETEGLAYQVLRVAAIQAAHQDALNWCSGLEAGARTACESAADLLFLPTFDAEDKLHLTNLGIILAAAIVKSAQCQSSYESCKDSCGCNASFSAPDLTPL
ncbi:MAG: RHS repeat-associated core domain-containing protein [Verrucomicrobiales bacterium]|nr:RHS repeat-associated core domain-containing protein [Verrucomicrobiales bacterium]